MLEADHLGRRTEGIEAGAFLLELLFGVTNGFDGEADAALYLINLDDASFNVVADLDDVFDFLHVVFAKLRNVDEAVDIAFEGNERTKGCDFRNLALDQVSDLEAIVDGGPWIVLGLFDAEGNALVAFVDRKDDGLDFIVLFKNFGRVVDLACPGHVRDVDHTVDALLKFYERAIGGEVADRAGDGRADRVAEFDLVPWVAFELADAEGDLLLLDADAENDCGDFLTEFENVGRTGDALDPAKLGNVHEAFDAALDFDERAVRKELCDLTLDLLADRVFALDVFPRVVGHLLEAERYALFLAVHVEDDDIHGLADVKQLGRMVDAAPRHIGDMKESVHALEIHERTEVGEVLDRADDLVADLDGLEKCLALLGALGFDDFAAGEDDVLALVVDLDDFELVNVSNVFGEIFRWNDVHL